MPRVSINLCCYNSERFLEATLQSVFAQTYTDWELVVVNDGSTDATGAIIRRCMAQGWPIVYHEQANRGIAETHNQALRLSSGELVAFIDHDDLWEPQKLQRQVPLFDRDPRVGLVCSDCVNVLDNGYAFRRFRACRPHEGAAYRQLLSRYFISTTTAVIRRRAVTDDQEWFDPSFRVLPDADFFLRVASRWHVAFVDELLARVHMHRRNTMHVEQDRLPIEMRALLEKQRRFHPNFDREFAEEIRKFFCELARGEARVAWERNQRRDALEHLRPHRRHFPEAQRDAWLIRCVPYFVYDRLRVLAARMAGMPK